MLSGEVIALEDMALLDDWSSNDFTVPSTSTVLKNKVFVCGGVYVGGSWSSGLYMPPWVITPQISKRTNSRTGLTILS